MEKGVKGCPMIRMGECFFWYRVPTYPGSPGPKAVKRLLLLLSHSKYYLNEVKFNFVDLIFCCNANKLNLSYWVKKQVHFILLPFVHLKCNFKFNTVV